MCVLNCEMREAENIKAMLIDFSTQMTLNISASVQGASFQ